MALDSYRGGVRGRRPSTRGRTYSYVRNGVEVTAKWPKARGRTLAQKTREQMEFFRNVQTAFKYSDFNVQREYIEAVAGSALLPRDLFLMAMSNRMFHFVLPDGRKVASMASVNDVSDSLDVFGQDTGAILVRQPEGWRILPPSDAGEVLTSTGPEGVPEWAAGGGGGGGNGEIDAWPVAQWVTQEGLAFATFGNAFVLESDIQVSEILAAAFADTGDEEFGAFIAQIDFTGAIVATVASGTGTFTVPSSGRFNMRFPLAAPVELDAGTLYIVALVLVNGANNSPCRPLSGSASEGFPMLPINIAESINTFFAPTRRYWYLNTSTAPGPLAASGNGASSSYAIGLHVTAGSQWGGRGPKGDEGPEGPPGPAAQWGNITGDLPDQADLTAALAGKLAVLPSPWTPTGATLTGHDQYVFAADADNNPPAAYFTLDPDLGPMIGGNHPNFVDYWLFGYQSPVTGRYVLDSTQPWEFQLDAYVLDNPILTSKRTLETVAGTSYTLDTADRGKLLTFTNAAAITVTIPTNATVSLPAGTEIFVTPSGAGQITFAPAAGVTLQSLGGALKSAGQHAMIRLTKKSGSVWLLSGDLTA